ncbi:hypothetical protein LJC36_00085 [Desulfovibrio sp. OttesenSCG-928-C14]|nr:hypothetical protein [Desulfovibrio sp. OttesenSCG-928-C14]
MTEDHAPYTPNPVSGQDEETRRRWREHLKDGDELKNALGRAPGQPSDKYPALPDLPEAPAIEKMLDDGRRVDAAVQSIVAQQLTCMQMIGQVQAMEAVSNYTATGRLVLLSQIKASKAYKGMKLPQPDGSLFTVNTFEDFCEALGLSRSKVDEDINNLNLFGEAFMESAQKIGLGYRQLRQLRALPPEKRDEILAVERQSNDPEVLKDLLEDAIIAKARAESGLEEKNREKQALEKLLDEKNKLADKQKSELIKLKNIPPSERVTLQKEREKNALEELHKEGFIVQGAFAALLAKVQGILEDEELSFQAREDAVYLVSALCSGIAQDILEAGVDVDFRAITYPLTLGDQPLRGDTGGAENPDGGK